MINDKRVLALIPARGGSKRLPGKNILNLAGKPMIAWSIQAGLDSKYIDKVVVSTDDSRIAETSLQYGGEVPFIRPEELSGDNAKSIDVISHALNYLREKGQLFDYLVLLQPTSPLRDSQYIDAAFRLMTEKKADCIIGMTEIEHPIEWVTELAENFCLDHFFNDEKFCNNQKNTKKETVKYRINGALYICSVERLLKEQTLFLKTNSYGFVMRREVSVDVDESMDFILCEALFRKQGLVNQTEILK